MSDLKLTSGCAEARSKAAYRAGFARHPEITCIHLLHGLIADSDNLVALAIKAVLQKKGEDLASLYSSVYDALDCLPAIPPEDLPEQPVFSVDARYAIHYAEAIAITEGITYIDSQHLLLGIYRDDKAASILHKHGVTREKVLEYLNRLV